MHFDLVTYVVVAAITWASGLSAEKGQCTAVVIALLQYALAGYWSQLGIGAPVRCTPQISSRLSSRMQVIYACIYVESTHGDVVPAQPA